MSKAIERRMTLRDQITPTMSKINKSTLGYKNNLRNLRKEGKRTWSGLKTGMVAMAAGITGMVLASGSAETAYNNQIEAEAKLMGVMKTTGKATAEQVNGLKKYAQQMQNIGVVGDEVTLSGMQQLATFNVTSSTVETLTAGMLDLVAQQKGYNATQGDMINISNMVGKAMSGQTGALSRVGIIFSDAQAEVLKFGTEEEKAATMAKVLEQNVGGVNAALLATNGGKIKQAKNAMSDLQEVAGGAVSSIKAGLASVFMDYLPQIQNGVENVTVAVTQWVENGGIQRFTSDIALVVDTIKMLAPVIGVAAAGLAAYKIYAMAAAASQWSLNAALAANPVGAVIMAIAALIGAIVWVRKHVEELKLGFMGLWNYSATKSQSAINTMIGGLNRFLNAAEYLKSSVQYAFSQMWDAMVIKAEEGVKKLIRPLNAVLEAMGKQTIDVNFTSAVKNMAKPTLQKKQYIKEIEVKKFSKDSIMEQVEKAKQEQEKYNAEKSEESAEAIAAAMSENTDALKENTGALKEKSVDLTGEEIADKLLPRFERVVYG